MPAPTAETNPSRNKTAQGFISLIILVASLWYFFGYKGVEKSVADDAIAQYGIAKRNGSAMDRCVQAGMVTAALLQSQEEAKYREWKDVENADCAAAGLSH